MQHQDNLTFDSGLLHCELERIGLLTSSEGGDAIAAMVS